MHTELRKRCWQIGVILATLNLTTIAAAQRIAIGRYGMPFGAVTGIAVGSDGALWFTEETGEIVGHLTTSGASYVSSSGSFSGPLEIVSGADGAMWLTEAYGSEIGRLTIGGFLNFYYIPTINSNPQGITAGPDGALWFTEGTGNNIGRITYTGLITEYPLPTANSGPNGITTGPDGALWFTEETSNKIGRITISGEVTEYALPTHNASPLRITSGTGRRAMVHGVGWEPDWADHHKQLDHRVHRTDGWQPAVWYYDWTRWGALVYGIQR